MQVINQATNLYATFGLGSSNPQRRREAEGLFAMITRQELMKQQRRQAAALESMSQGGAFAEDGDGLNERNVYAFLNAIQKFSREQPSKQVINRYGHFGQRLDLTGQSLSFAVGAAHSGYAVRRAEEALDPGLAANDPIAGRLRRGLVTGYPGASAEDLAFRAAAAIAEQNTWQGVVLSIELFPGPAHGRRETTQEQALTLLTSPGAAFRVRPRGISEKQVGTCWAFGFATRCVEQAERPPVARAQA
jgi:hypothetical protein